MKYGLLLVCCKNENGNSLCIVRGLKFLFSQEGDLVTNEFDCPSLMLTRTVFVTKPSTVLKAVSVIHECGARGSCKFAMRQCQRTIEREQLYLSSRVEYEHDYCTNRMYYLNVYCMNF